MARHRRRHRMGALVRFPGLGSLPSVKAPVKPIDVALGAAAGLAAAVAVKKGSEALAANGTMVPSFVSSAGPITAGVATGAIAYLVRKKKNRSQATGLAVGAILGGLIVTAYGALQSNGMLGALVDLPRGMGGPIFSNPNTITRSAGLSGFRGPIFDNPNTHRNLGRLAQMQGFGDENEDGMFPAP